MCMCLVGLHFLHHIKFFSIFSTFLLPPWPLTFTCQPVFHISFAFKFPSGEIASSALAFYEMSRTADFPLVKMFVSNPCNRVRKVKNKQTFRNAWKHLGSTG